MGAKPKPMVSVCGELRKKSVWMCGKSRLIQIIKRIIFKLMNERLTASTAAVECHKVNPSSVVNSVAPINWLCGVDNPGILNQVSVELTRGPSSEAPPDM